MRGGFASLIRQDLPSHGMEKPPKNQNFGGVVQDVKTSLHGKLVGGLAFLVFPGFLVLLLVEA